MATPQTGPVDVHLADALHEAHIALGELGNRLPYDDEFNVHVPYARCVSAIEHSLSLMGEDFGSPLLTEEGDR